jgi:uncharacterized protein YndB with AHSA1/START domain
MAPPPIVVERTMPATPNEVFEHWSDPESLAEWMRPSEGMRRASVDVDFRVGGKFRIVMHGEQDFAQHGEYLEIETDRRIVFTWISEWLPAEEQQTLVTVSLEPIGSDETRLLLVHESLPAGDAYQGHESGWARILAGLGTAVQEGDPQ